MRRSTVRRLVPLGGIAVLLLAGCAPAPEQSGSSTDAAASDYCARMVTNSGGLEDKSFNQTSWAGLQEASKKYGIEADVLVSTSETDVGPNTEQAAASGCQFVLTVGYELTAATLEQAKANPDTHFSIVDETADADGDGKPDADNVKPIVFDTAQASYLAGYLAAGVSKTGVVGTFGGGNQPPVTLFMDGFVDGVAKYNEAHGAQVKVLGWDKAAQDGVFTGDFENVNLGKTTAQGLIDQGADVILPVAGQVGEGGRSRAGDRRRLDPLGRQRRLRHSPRGVPAHPADERPQELHGRDRAGRGRRHRRQVHQRPLRGHAGERRRRHRRLPRHGVFGARRAVRRDRQAEAGHHQRRDHRGVALDAVIAAETARPDISG
ncbi:BMP family lipoprotein [Naasia aerilata]